jgi:hypothetical protein
MADFEDLVAKICKRPGMYVGCDSFAAVCAYLHGYDAARDEGPLMGFHAWMVLRQDSGNNVGWDWLVLADAIGPMPGRDIAELSADQNRLCVQKLGELLAEFFADRRRRTLTGILHDYAKWLLRKKWYDGPLRRG